MKNYMYNKAYCIPPINDIKLVVFSQKSGVPQGCSMSCVLYNIATIPLLAKLNSLPTHRRVRPYQILAHNSLNEICIKVCNIIASAYADEVFSAVTIDESRLDPEVQVKPIMDIYEEFSKVS